MFAEATFDITPKLTLTGGIRGYHYKQHALSASTATAPTTARTPAKRTASPGLTLPGRALRRPQQAGLADSGETHKVNLSYKFDGDEIVYFTYSTGFRPGGVNRNGGGSPPYQADTLDNYEVGWKTRLVRPHADLQRRLYDEEWNKFQFAFLGLNSLTIIAERAVGADHRASSRLRLAGHPAVSRFRAAASLQSRGR